MTTATWKRKWRGSVSSDVRDGDENGDIVNYDQHSLAWSPAAISVLFDSAPKPVQAVSARSLTRVTTLITVMGT